MKPKIIFTKDTIHYILEALELGVYPVTGYVYDLKTNLLCTDMDGNAFVPEDIIGIFKDKFITNHLQLFNLTEEEWGIEKTNFPPNDLREDTYTAEEQKRLDGEFDKYNNDLNHM